MVTRRGSLCRLYRLYRNSATSAAQVVQQW